MTAVEQECETKRILEFLFDLPPGLHPVVRYQAQLIQQDLRAALASLGVLNIEQRKFNIKLYEAKREQGFIRPDVMWTLESKAEKLISMTSNRKLS